MKPGSNTRTAVGWGSKTALPQRRICVRRRGSSTGTCEEAPIVMEEVTHAGRVEVNQWPG